jgi:hypothetical protein
VHLSRLQDVINNLKKEISETEKSIETESARLTEEVTRLQHSIKDIDNKADHFAEMNVRKYQQVWELNRDTAKKLLDKVIIIMFSIYILSSCRNYKLQLSWRKGFYLDSVLMGEEVLSYTELHNFLVNQILDIDRMLHQQQLGLEWASPDLSLLHQEDLASYQSAMQVVANIFTSEGETKIGVV